MQHPSHPPACAFLWQAVCLDGKFVVCDSAHSAVPWLLDADANSEQHSACLEDLWSWASDSTLPATSTCVNRLVNHWYTHNSTQHSQDAAFFPSGNSSQNRSLLKCHAVKDGFKGESHVWIRRGNFFIRMVILLRKQATNISSFLFR